LKILLGLDISPRVPKKRLNLVVLLLIIIKAW
jgi:hypothetical protein